MCSGRDYFGKESIFGEGMEFGMRKEFNCEIEEENHCKMNLIMN